MSRDESKGGGNEGFPVLTSCSYNLFHAPFFTLRYGTTAEAERMTRGDSEFIKEMEGALRSYRDVASYPPNLAFIGTIDPRILPDRPWSVVAGESYDDSGGKGEKVVTGPFGDILDESILYGCIKISDVFDLVSLENEFSRQVKKDLMSMKVFKDADLSCFDKARERGEIRKSIDDGALPLSLHGNLVGCIQSAHPNDRNLDAHTILENLASKATGVYALRTLLSLSGTDPESIDYIIETSEEACGDMNQRGGGNFAKAIGESAGCTRATGSDTRSFCAGPVHGLVQAASLVKAGTFSRVVVVAGGTTAKLGMNCRKHMKKGLPVLEDCMGSFALLVEKNNGKGISLRTDAVGTHKIGSGASPQAVVNDLVVDPVYRAGFTLKDIDYYAPELHNPEITENAGAGNVTEANLKMIAAMAVMKKEIERDQIPGFIRDHGSTGWAPTQGHVPSGIPALGWLNIWIPRGEMSRGLVIGKGSLFLGRMTNLFDGISILVEQSAEHGTPGPVKAKTVIGITLPGSESGEEELKTGAVMAMDMDRDLEVQLIGTGSGDPEKARRDMEERLSQGVLHGAVTFHYPFPIGVTTVGHRKAGYSGKDLFISSTTGTSSTSRVEALVLNGIYGQAAARAYGLIDPVVGFLNLDGAAIARKTFSRLIDNGYQCRLGVSARGDILLRGNDVLGGTVDVLVCDSLTGNVITKLLGSYENHGAVETSGSGYGPGIGEVERLVVIISRATAAPVVRDALLFTARLARSGLLSIYKREITAAKEAGLENLLLEIRRQGTAHGQMNTGEGLDSNGGNSEASPVKHPSRKVVDREIGGIDVLLIEDAVALLMGKGLFCEPGMGCTGPVVMVAGEDREKAEAVLKDANLL